MPTAPVWTIIGVVMFFLGTVSCVPYRMPKNVEGPDASKLQKEPDSGDFGTANPLTLSPLNFFPFPTVGFPASSPLVTAVGTSLYADLAGKYQSEIVWNNAEVTFASGLVAGAGGGGVSQQFSEPPYQFLLPAPVQHTLNHHRGIPDVAYNADPFTAILVYIGFFPNPNNNGYYFIGGTSDGSPQRAGIIADANQLAGHPLGFLNPKLYSLGALCEQSESFHDIRFGSNAFPFNGVPGYIATPGWGTPKAEKLVRELAEHR